MQLPTISPRDRAVKRTLRTVLVLNLAVTIAKLVVGWLTSSIAMIADGFHSLTDTAANVVGLIAMSVAQQPPDEDHPYGHRRFETLAALIIGVTTASLTKAVVPKHKSELLLADSEHTRSDILTSLAVVASLIGARLGYPWLDLIAAAGITVIIGRTAFRILRDNTLLLADTALVPSDQIREVAMEVPEVISVHKIRSRGSSQVGHADLHIQVRADLPLDVAHGIGHQVSDRIRDRFGLSDVLVHVEPIE